MRAVPERDILDNYSRVCYTERVNEERNQAPQNLRRLEMSIYTTSTHTTKHGQELKITENGKLLGFSWSVEELTPESIEHVVKDIEAQQPFNSDDELVAYVNDLIEGTLEDQEQDTISELEEARRMKIPSEYRASYGQDQHCGDELALALKEINIAELGYVAKQNNLVDKWESWSHLNNGQKRMNLGNVLRGRLKRGERVEVSSMVWEGLPERTLKAIKIANKILAGETTDKQNKNFLINFQDLILAQHAEHQKAQ